MQKGAACKRNLRIFVRVGSPKNTESKYCFIRGSETLGRGLRVMPKTGAPDMKYVKYIGLITLHKIYHGSCIIWFSTVCYYMQDLIFVLNAQAGSDF